MLYNYYNTIIRDYNPGTIVIIKNLRISEGNSPKMTQNRVQRWGFEVNESYKEQMKAIRQEKIIQEKVTSKVRKIVENFQI